jgi:formylglycine-generating enzyme required for sulfatase activity
MRFADGQGILASFFWPEGVAVDGSGNVYVADTGNHRIRKISPSTDVTTLAGGAVPNNSDYPDGQGNLASFLVPYSIAMDENGNVYVADQQNNRIRKITQNGNVTTLAGSRSVGYADGRGNSASFYYPSGVAADDSGSFYVSDTENHVIRKITQNGDVTTLAGSGIAGFADGQGTSASFSYPCGVAIDRSGNLYVADVKNHRIRKITQNGDVTTLAGSGVAGFADSQGTSASFDNPTGVTVDNSGNLYVADKDNHRIRKITPNGTVSTLAGSGIAGFVDKEGTLARFSFPTGLAMDESGNLYVADRGNNRIRKITQTETLVPTENMVTVVGGTMPQPSYFTGETVETFQIGKYEVTGEEWQEVRAWALNNGYSDLANARSSPTGDHPVQEISWYDAVKWTNAKSQKDGLVPVYQVSGAVYKTGESVPIVNKSANGYRLPTEREWEWAAKGGVRSQGYTYSGSNDASVVAWHFSNSVGLKTESVGTKAPNELGIHDLSGNVWEWCEDVAGTFSRVIRGGSVKDYAVNCSVGIGNSANADDRNGFYGIRLARNAP